MRWRWPWRKRVELPEIPPYPTEVTHKPDKYPAIERHIAPPKALHIPGFEVEEHDTSSVDQDALRALREAQSQTGMHRAWRKLTGQD
jgi:hypothetical protein